MSLIIGIDPDLEASGVATLKNGQIESLECLSFPKLIELIVNKKLIIKKVVIEAGWLNAKSNWHQAKTIQVAAKIGKNVGENHATGKILAQMIAAMGVSVQLVRPTASKLNAEQFKKLTGFAGMTNPEKRDAGVLVWGMS
jgi:hypothetical protein